MDFNLRFNLSLVLLLSVVACILAQRRNAVLKVCNNVPPDFNLRIAGRRTSVQCPCLFSSFVSVSQRAGTVNVSVFALPAKDFTKWDETYVDRGGSAVVLPSSENAVVLKKTLGLNRRSGSEGRRRWQSGTKAINDTGPFNILIFLNVEQSAPCIDVAMTLEARPDVCPLRLAGPSPAADSDDPNDPNDPEEIVTNSAVAAPREVAAYVVGGTRVGDRDEFAAYNALVSTSRGNCTGSLISESWVLTAAHCRTSVGSRVLVGGSDHASGERRVVLRVETHPDFAGGTFAAQALLNDVAVVQLDRPVLNGVPVALNNNSEGPSPGTIARATGYGKRTTRTLGSSRYLLMVDNTILSTDECQGRFVSNRKFSIARGVDADAHMCAGRDKECDSGGVCFGDSGGPIVARSRGGHLVQVGVTSYGDPQCAQEGLPDVYVRVSEVVPWIRSVVGDQITTRAWVSVENTAKDETASRFAGVPLRTIIIAAVFAGFLVVAVGLVLVAKVVKNRREKRDSAYEGESADPVSVAVGNETTPTPPTYSPPPEWIPPPPPTYPPGQSAGFQGMGSRPIQ